MASGAYLGLIQSSPVSPRRPLWGRAWQGARGRLPYLPFPLGPVTLAFVTRVGLSAASPRLGLGCAFSAGAMEAHVLFLVRSP